MIDRSLNYIVRAQNVLLWPVRRREDSIYILHYQTLSAPWTNYPCKNDRWGRSLLPEILGQTDRVEAKSPIFGLFSLVAPQP